jgi:prepilin-type N-terminal cleavage/methylation domain-containing protein
MSARVRGASVRPRGAAARRQHGITLMELLIAMSILSVVTAMILVSWFALQSSFGQTSKASHAREFARDAVARMTQEIRDAQGSDQGSAITEATRWEIVFYSTYNMAGNATTGTTPRQTAFVYMPPTTTETGRIYRVVDRNGNGLADELGVNNSLVTTNGRLVVDNVVNWEEPNSTTKTSLFQYTYYTGNGSYTTVDDLPATESPTSIRAVQIRVLVDLNPGKSPVYIDMKTTAQPRNQRPAT